MLQDDGSAEMGAAAALGQVVDSMPPSQAGIASWYGPGFHGRKSANGEALNMGGLTAAHR